MPPDRAGASRLTRRLLAAAVALAALALYAKVRAFGFLPYDDSQYVWENPVVRQGLTWRGAGWAFRTLFFANWHPLTWLSHMLDVELFGLDAGAHHLASAAIHAANAGLLLLVLARMTGAPWPSALVAALFALHPLHVESVAWVAERKDVLSTLLGFLMLGAYGLYARRPGAAAYLLVLLCLALSLMAKPMWVTAPFLLLLLDAWPLQRWEGSPLAPDARCPASPRLPLRHLVLEKLPLLALSAGSSAITAVAQQRGGALTTVELYGPGTRLANAVLSYARYLGKALWPADLAAFYPFRPEGALAPLAAAVLLAAVTALAISRARSMPWLLVGWLWYLGTLVPVIGLVQVGSQAMADRYTYLPLVGVFLAAAFGLERAATRFPRARAAVAAATVLGLGALAAAAHFQIAHWRDQESLFRHSLAATGQNARAEHLLSQGLIAAGKLEEALPHAAAAARLDPENARAHRNLGYVLYRLGRVDEAIAALERAVALDPDDAEAHGNLGIAYGKRGRLADAMREMSIGAELRRRAAAR
jgi:tetratricopeptide (TPR) repeat protein